MSPAEVRPFYEQADLFVFPTLADEWGLVVAEALAAGLPVLGSRHSRAVEELVVEDANGWVFSPRDRSETQGAIGRALSGGPEVLGAMHPACQGSVRHLSPDNVADRMLDAVLFGHPAALRPPGRHTPTANRVHSMTPTRRAPTPTRRPACAGCGP